MFKLQDSVFLLTAIILFLGGMGNKLMAPPKEVPACCPATLTPGVTVLLPSNSPAARIHKHNQDMFALLLQAINKLKGINFAKMPALPQDTLKNLCALKKLHEQGHDYDPKILQGWSVKCNAAKKKHEAFCTADLCEEWIKIKARYGMALCSSIAILMLCREMVQDLAICGFLGLAELQQKLLLQFIAKRIESLDWQIKGLHQ